jgi:uncharacterized protein YacL
MRKILIIAIITTSLGIIASILLSILGHYKIWYFSNDIKANVIYVGLILVLLGCFLFSTDSEETGKGMMFYSNTIRYGPEGEDKFETKKLSMIIFGGTGVLLILLSCLCPELKI